MARCKKRRGPCGSRRLCRPAVLSRQRDCRARRHWNSTSYRSAAGNILIGEKHAARGAVLHRRSGAEGSRTPDLCSAIAALSQLSYSPSYPGVRRPFPSRRTGPVTKQPRWVRGRADIVSYDASGGCQAPPDRARRLSLGGRTRAREVTYAYACDFAAIAFQDWARIFARSDEMP